MRPPLVLELDEQQRRELEALRDHAPKAYLRERAAALLKKAEGWSAVEIAERGLLKRRKPETIYQWITAYLLFGVRGLTIQPGRGRKPAFSP